VFPPPKDYSTVASLLRHPRASRQRVERFRDSRLRKVIQHAYAKVPYYREVFDRHGVSPHDIRTAADLAALPLTSKLDLQARPLEDVLTRGMDPTALITRSTSGSLGIPFMIRRARSEESLLRVVVTRTALYHGYRPTFKHASVVFPRPRGPETPTGRIVRGMGLFRFRDIDCRWPPEDILAALEEFDPQFISGYSGSLARVARLIDPRRTSLAPRAIVSGAEVLTRGMREQIEKGFQAPVFDTYGSHEFTRIAYQCRESDNFHICDDTVVVEVVANGRPVEVGERGEVVATALHSYAMPFIRYRLGDIVTRGADTCTCGQPFSTLREVQGRMVDLFTMPGGRTMHPYELMAVVADSIEDWWIQEYQLTQESSGHITFRAVPMRPPTAEELQRIQDAASHLLGPDVEFRLDVVDEIPLTPGGKFRVYRSFINSPHDREADIGLGGQLPPS